MIRPNNSGFDRLAQAVFGPGHRHDFGQVETQDASRKRGFLPMLKGTFMAFDRKNSVLFQNRATKRLLAEHLKSCPVCDALNSSDTDSCFVCGWHGSFEHDSQTIEHGLDDLLSRCPELVEAMIMEAEVKQSPWDKIKSRVLTFFRKARTKRVDFRV